MTDNPSTDSWWSKLSPGVKAALAVAGPIVLLEVLSDLLPAVGYLVALPLAIVTYTVQGLLVGWFLKNDPRYASAGPGASLRAAAVSAFWSGVVLSNAVTLIDTLLLTVVTLGGVLVGLPLALVTTLVDIALNFILTLLGAWLYRRFSGRRLLAVSCTVMGLALVGLCLVGAVAAGTLAVSGVGLLRGLPARTVTTAP